MSNTVVSGVIYGLHAGDGYIRYIGQTIKSPVHRLSSHKNSAKNGSKLHSHTWMRSVGVDNVAYTILESFDEATIDRMDEREIYYIALYRSMGVDLTNIAIGGSSNRGYVPSEETRRRISQAGMGRKMPPMSDRQKAIISATHKGKTISLEQRMQQSEAMAGNQYAKGNKTDPELVKVLTAKRMATNRANPDFKRICAERAALNNHTRWHTNRGIVKAECIHCT